MHSLYDHPTANALKNKTMKIVNAKQQTANQPFVQRNADRLLRFFETLTNRLALLGKRRWSIFFHRFIDHCVFVLLDLPAGERPAADHQPGEPYSDHFVFCQPGDVGRPLLVFAPVFLYGPTPDGERSQSMGIVF
ncbi:MAG: hypothetical protein IPJ82_07000 [Lewinellaceae bacterium]|nr:hypothetical protein [Lewinellaceae bacterium]